MSTDHDSSAAPGSLAMDSSRRVATVAVGELRHPPNWVRNDMGTKEERIALARSYQHRANNLILISPDGVIRDGNRRVDGIIEDTGPDTQVLVCITDEDITPAVALEIMLETSEHTKPLTPFEQFVGYSRWMSLNNKTAAELAAKIRKHESVVSRILSLAKCPLEVQEAAKAGKLNVSEWYAISRKSASAATQHRMLGAKLENPDMTRDELQAFAEQDSEGENATPPEKTDSIKVIVGGFTVIIKRKGDLTIDDAIKNALPEALKELERSKKAGHDAKTLAALMRKKAKAN